MSVWNSLLERAESELEQIWENLGKNNLWKRMLKMWLASTICSMLWVVIIALIPGIEKIYGRAVYFAVITTVFGHPGRRLGMMAEALLLALSGTLLGLGWSLLGIYLGSLAYPSNKSATYAIRGVFLSLSFLFHGFLRSQTPRLFIFVLLLVIMTTALLTSTAVTVNPPLVTQLLYPVLTATAVLLLVNIFIFPEFSSGFLGRTTLETLDETVEILRKSGQYFMKTTGEQALETTEIEKEDTAEGATHGVEITKEGSPMSRKPRGWGVGNIFSRKSNTKDRGKSSPEKKLTLRELTDAKSKLRASLAGCKSVQEECNFELVFSVLPPRYMKPISVKAMKKLVGHVIALVGACESKYALMGEEESEPSPELNEVLDGDSEEDDTSSTGQGLSRPETPSDDSETVTGKQGKRDKKRKKKLPNLEVDDLELVKPRREIEFADKKLLKYLVGRISVPLAGLQQAIDRSLDVVNCCVAYAYDVPKLPNGSRAPKGIVLPEVDVHIETLEQALLHFDESCTSALEGAVVLEELQNKEVDIMPRDETFLIASFILNLRQAGASTLEMLKHSRTLVERREGRHGRKKLYFPRIHWRKWLFSGGDNEESLPHGGSRKTRQGHGTDADVDEDSDAEHSHTNLVLDTSRGSDQEAAASVGQIRDGQAKNDRDEMAKRPCVSKPTNIRRKPWTLRRRESLASFLDWAQASEHVIYAFKFTIGALLVSWPALVPSWNRWYSLNRGLWAALQLVLILEVAIGTSVKVFILRSIGTTLGCVWGYVAYSAGHGNRVVCGAVLSIGVIPSTYVQLGTPYMKAGMVIIISMAVVALSTELQTVPGTAAENFFKRLVSFLIGGSVALLIELTVFPTKARTRLVELLAMSIRRIGDMEGCIAYGLEDGSSDEFPPSVRRRFEKVSEKAKAALEAAETYLPFCEVEPRLKGPFDGLALIYSEIIFVLHQIVDRMDNMIQLRVEYGSVVLEEIHHHVLPYRQNIAASITLILFAVHEALTTKLPLPQFLPSARLAHLRMVNRVREVLITTGRSGDDDENFTIGRLARRRAVRKKFMATNAASAASEECIEYLEELIELTKLLVGANEFKTGLLTRPTYLEYASRIGDRHGHRDSTNHKDITLQPVRRPTAGTRRRTGTGGSKRSEDNQDIPNALRRIQSKRKDAKLQNQRSNDSAQKQKGKTA